MFDFIIFLIVLLLFIYFVGNNIKLRIKNLGLVQTSLQAYIDKNIMSEKLNLALLEKDKADLENGEDFLKFISQSRDWAFEYIESTQKDLHSFITKAGPIIDYWAEYSTPILLEEQRLVIVEQYKKIKALLPDNYGKLE